MSSPPAALEISRPIGTRNEGARTFWYEPPSFRAPGRADLRSRLRRALRGYRLCLYLLVRTRPTLPLSAGSAGGDRSSSSDVAVCSVEQGSAVRRFGWGVKSPARILKRGRDTGQ
eukprot:67355-Pleurochrysis_carterae.AAC.1